MSRYDTSGLYDTDIAALRGLGSNAEGPPCPQFLPAGAQRQACASEWQRIQGSIDPVLQAAGPEGPKIAALNRERQTLQAAITALLQRRPDLRAAAPAVLMQAQPGEPPPANLQTIRAITRRLRRLLAVLVGLAAATAAGGGGGSGGGGSSGGGGGGASTPPPVSPGAEIASLNQERAQLQQVINAGFAARPELRASAPQNLMRAQPGEPGVNGQAANLESIRRAANRLRSLVAWMSAQPDRDEAPTQIAISAGAPVGVSPSGALQPYRSTTAADFGDQWGSSAAQAPDPYASAYFGAQVGPTLYAGKSRAVTAESFGPQWGSSALPCGLGGYGTDEGMGSWLSSAFKKITGQRLSDTLPALTSAIPVVGGVVSNIVQGNAGNAVQQIMSALTPAQKTATIAAVAGGKPCANVSPALKSACQLEVAKLADRLREQWGAAPGAGPCNHLRAAQKVKCLDQRRAAWDAIAASFAAGNTPAAQLVAALTPGPTDAADVAAAQAAAATATSRGGAMLPLALGAGALLLLMGTR